MVLQHDPPTEPEVLRYWPLNHSARKNQNIWWRLISLLSGEEQFLPEIRTILWRQQTQKEASTVTSSFSPQQVKTPPQPQHPIFRSFTQIKQETPNPDLDNQHPIFPAQSRFPTLEFHLKHEETWQYWNPTHTSSNSHTFFPYSPSSFKPPPHSTTQTATIN